MSLNIRFATSADVARIVDFSIRLAFETEELVLAPPTVTRGVEKAIQLAPEMLYFVAEKNDTVVGQLMLTREWSDWRDGWLYWLGSVYVDAKFRGQGIFRSLLSHARKELANLPDTAGFRLYVEQDNAVAIETYSRLGFSDAGYRIMEDLKS